tara:strand:- start:4777 stop:5106 length:330 start_codon:yes stop_codon:yes gene_type:complete
MKITKRQLKRIIREEYSKLKRKGLIREYGSDLDYEAMQVSAEILQLASRPDGVSLDEINDMFGPIGFDCVDAMCSEGSCWLDDQEGVVYAAGSQPSSGLGSAVDRYTRK